MNMGLANLDVFADTLLELARHNRDVLVVTSDSRGSGKLTPFGQELPTQHIEVGIAEQNLVGVAAGLAAAGKIVYAVSPACFLTARSFEQVKNDVAYSDQPVKLVGISAGVSYGALGVTHHSLHDLAALRAVHNLTIIAPADNHETRESVRAAAGYPHPVYLRFGKKVMPAALAPEVEFVIGRARAVVEGGDITFIATGETVQPACAASALLAQDGIHARVVSMHTIKPLDAAAVQLAALETGAIITAEEHSVHGGLGEACAAFLMQNRLHIPFKIVGITDEYNITGSQGGVFDYYGLSAPKLAAAARALLATR